MSTDCGVTDDRLLPLVNGSADPEERAELERHLATCARCRRAVADWRAVRDAVVGEVPATAPPALLDAVFARLDDDDRARPPALTAPAASSAAARARRRWSRPLLLVAAAAAVLVIVVAVSVVGSTPDPALAALRGAVEATEATGSARYDLTGTATLTLSESNPGSLGGAEVVGAITGTIEADFPDRSRKGLRLEPVGEPVVPFEAIETETLRIGDEGFERTPAGDWAPIRQEASIVSRLLLATEFDELLDAAEGDVEDLGVTARGDGGATALRHYRFRIADDDPDLPFTGVADAFVDPATQLLTEVRIVATGPVAEPLERMDWDLTLRLSDVGSPIDLTAPAVTVPPPTTT